MWRHAIGLAIVACLCMPFVSDVDGKTEQAISTEIIHDDSFVDCRLSADKSNSIKLAQACYDNCRAKCRNSSNYTLCRDQCYCFECRDCRG